MKNLESSGTLLKDKVTNCRLGEDGPPVTHRRRPQRDVGATSTPVKEQARDSNPRFIHEDNAPPGSVRKGACDTTCRRGPEQLEVPRVPAGTQNGADAPGKRL